MKHVSSKERPSKAALLSTCMRLVRDRIANAEQAIASANAAAADDTKSSAGDKFETTREMMQQEISRHQQLLASGRQMELVLRSIDISEHAGPARLGSLVETDRGFFFLAVSAGPLAMQGQKCVAVSTASPIGQLMLGKTAGQRFMFNNTEYLIASIA